jgi:plastocyanin
MRRALLAAAVAATVLAPGSAPPAHAAPNVIVAVGSVYQPAVIVVPRGTGVTFVNLDTIFHDVTAEFNEFRSATISRGATKVHDVEGLAPNTYNYFCTVHEGMLGQVIVV